MGASEKVGAAFHPATGPAIPVDSAHLLAAMRKQMEDAEALRDQPGAPRSACDAYADAFGTVIDWFEDAYLPGVTR